jgi:hypothetical protein
MTFSSDLVVWLQNAKKNLRVIEFERLRTLYA